MSVATPLRMQSKAGPRNHGELIAWQLCTHLRRLIWDATRDGPAAADRRYCDQIRSSARTACYLTSEGFYRGSDGDFLNCLITARASLGEVETQIEEGVNRQFFTKVEHGVLKEALARACSANRRLRDHVQRRAEQDTKRKTVRRV